METISQTMRRKGINNLYKLDSDELRDFIKERSVIRKKTMAENDILEEIRFMEVGDTLTLRVSAAKITKALEKTRVETGMNFKRYFGGKSFTRIF